MKNNWNYQTSVNKIEEIIRQIESGSLPLEQVFEQFAIAKELLLECETFLNKGKEKMNLIIEDLAEKEEIDF